MDRILRSWRVGCVAVVVFTSCLGKVAFAESGIEGKWKYQSYCPEPVSVSADPTPPTFVRWSPEGLVTIDDGGTTGTLQFIGTPIKLSLNIRVTEGTPKSITVSAVMPLPGGKKFTNELHGWIVPSDLGQGADNNNNPTIRGAIIQTSDDIAPVNPKPIGTTGYFILERLP